MVRGFLFVFMAGVVACGGGGSGGVPSVSFQLAGTSPDAGEIDASTVGALAFSFTSSGSFNINPRRGDHSVTRWGSANQFLIAGGQDVANGAGPKALDSMVVARYTGDVELYNVVNVRLPVHFSGHVGIALNNGVTLLAGGVGDRVNDHSRRVVLVTID